MKDNCPMGAECSPLAPYNQSDPKPVKVDCCVSYSLSKSMPVNVTNYNISEGYESEVDDEGHRYCNKIQENDFDDTNFIEEFKNDDEAIGIPTLLIELRTLCQEAIDSYKATMDIITQVSSNENIKSMKKKIKHYELLIKASEGWIVDDLDVCQE